MDLSGFVALPCALLMLVFFASSFFSKKRDLITSIYWSLKRTRDTAPVIVFIVACSFIFLPARSGQSVSAIAVGFAALCIAGFVYIAFAFVTAKFVTLVQFVTGQSTSIDDESSDQEK